MLRLVLFLVGLGALATGLSWLADRPGLIQFTWQDYTGQISVFQFVVALTFLIGFAIFLYSLAKAIWKSPAAVGDYFYKRRQKRGLDALSAGIIAIGAGDSTNAMRHAVQARKTMPNEPLTQLLRAQAAQLAGDRVTARRIFEAMLSQPDTEQLGLRGLFLEAEREGAVEAARQFAERALSLNPKLAWSTEALFDMQLKAEDWSGALLTLAAAKKHGHVEKSLADRRRAVLLTAQAQAAEDRDPERALALAVEAHALAPNLVPAAAIAGHLLASRGNTAKAAKILQRTWLMAPHPDLATAYAYARVGDSPRDRLARVRQLAAMQQNSVESAVALARAAIEARDLAEARAALEPFLQDKLTGRVATLMARIEHGEHGSTGGLREWLSRATSAERDPAWTADGIVLEAWAPRSPVTGELDAVEWRVPDATAETQTAALLGDQLDELLALAAPGADIVAAPASAAATTASAATATTPATKASASSPAAAATSAAAEVAPHAPAPAAASPATSVSAATPQKIAAVTPPPGSAANAPARATPDASSATQAPEPKPAQPRIFVSPRTASDKDAEITDLEAVDTPRQRTGTTR